MIFPMTTLKHYRKKKARSVLSGCRTVGSKLAFSTADGKVFLLLSVVISSWKYHFISTGASCLDPDFRFLVLHDEFCILREKRNFLARLRHGRNQHQATQILSPSFRCWTFFFR
ncbi:unnamed protein product [Amoebophrya sp. A120]|nr:unnamed protein product [Amoebophrya sp. A120]|eukprot:GSA120T00019224001.1